MAFDDIVGTRPPSEASAGDNARWFISVTENVIESILREEFGPDTLDHEQWSGLAAAWDELYEVGRFEEVYAGIGQQQQQLAREGFEGAQGQAKVSAVDVNARRIAELETGRNGPLGRRLLKKLLSILDTVLESIGSAVPAAGAIAEIKSMIEEAIKED